MQPETRMLLFDALTACELIAQFIKDRSYVALELTSRDIFNSFNIYTGSASERLRVNLNQT